MYTLEFFRKIVSKNKDKKPENKDKKSENKDKKPENNKLLLFFT